MAIEAGPLAIVSRTKEFAPELCAAMAQLAKAHDYAQDLQCDPWEFAVEIERLLALGISSSDLRWLIKKGYVEHAREITHSGDVARRFQPAKSLAFSRATCFSVTQSGLALLKAKGGANGYAAPAGVRSCAGKVCLCSAMGPRQPRAVRGQADRQGISGPLAQPRIGLGRLRGRRLAEGISTIPSLPPSNARNTVCGTRSRA